MGDPEHVHGAMDDDGSSFGQHAEHEAPASLPGHAAHDDDSSHERHGDEMHDHGHDHPHDHGHDHPHDHGHDHPHDHGHDHPHEHDLHDDREPGWRHRLTHLVGSVVGHSHAPADSLDDALTTSRRGIRALKVSLLALGVTAVLQLAIVLVSGSVALLADTVHNLADALTAVPLWIAFAVGTRAATRRYTFGYRRAEDLAGLFVVLVILASALLAAWQSIERLIEPQAIDHVPAVILAGFIGFAGNEAVALYRIRVGREIGSAALIADGYHARTDGLTSLAVVAGAVGVALGYPLADPLVGLLISAVILVVLRQAAGQMLGRLMDAVEPQLVDQVERVAAGTAGVQAVEAIRLRWVGHALEASLAIMVDRDLTVAAGHQLAEEVRHRLLHQVPRLDTALVHVDPCHHAGGDAHALTRHHEAAMAAPPAPATVGRPPAVPGPPAVRSSALPTPGAAVER